MSRAVLITGATGKQGGAVVNALLKANADFEILALTRDSQSASAQRLVQKSPKIKLVAGNLDAPDNIFSKAKEITKTPIWGVYSVQVGLFLSSDNYHDSQITDPFSGSHRWWSNT